MRPSLFLLGLAIAASLWSYVGAASAHPHVWVATTLSLQAKRETIEGFHIHWVFDDFYSSTFVEDIDANNNKKLDPQELLDLTQTIFIKDPTSLYPFIYVAVEGQKKAFRFQNPRIWMDKKILVYDFDVVLSTPLATGAAFKLAVFDPSYYISFDEDPAVQIPDGLDCRQALGEDETISIYYDIVHPQTYQLSCQTP